MLSKIRQIGDVILVDDENAIEDVDLDGYSSLINSEVITETGELLGKVRGFRLNIDSGKVDTLTVASIGLPLIPDQIVSTYELPIDEIVSSGPDRLIVYEGAEERMSQISVGILERLGIGKPPWERDESEQYLAPIRTENQLPSGVRTPIQTQVRQPVEETWNEDNWEPEPLPLRQEAPRRQAELYYENEEEGNWSAAVERDSYEEEYDEDYDDEEDYVTEVEFEEVKEPEAKFDDPEEDPWKDEDKEPYTPQELKIPEKVKQPEYEEESY